VIIDKECRLLAQGYNGEINTGQVRKGAVDANMTNLRDVVERKVISIPKKGNKFLRVCTNGSCTVHVAVKEETMKSCSDFEELKATEQTAKRKRPSLPSELEDEKSSKGADGAIHAEMNALLYARCGRDEFKGAIAIVSLMPCPQCFKLLAQAGIEYLIILSDSGRYVDTLRLIGALGDNAPKVIPLDLIVPYIDVGNCINTKVFKSELVPFIKPPTKDGKLQGELNSAEQLSDEFDYNYEAIVFSFTDVAPLDKLFRALFRIM
jgi:deoxycytidylate deaminase